MSNAKETKAVKSETPKTAKVPEKKAAPKVVKFDNPIIQAISQDKAESIPRMKIEHEIDGLSVYAICMAFDAVKCLRKLSNTHRIGLLAERKIRVTNPGGKHRFINIPLGAFLVGQNLYAAGFTNNGANQYIPNTCLRNCNLWPSDFYMACKHYRPTIDKIRVNMTEAGFIDPASDELRGIDRVNYIIEVVRKTQGSTVWNSIKR